MKVTHRTLLAVLIALVASIGLPASSASAAWVGCDPQGYLQYSQTYGAIQGNSGAWCSHSGWPVTVSTKMYKGSTLVGSKSGTCTSRASSTCSIGIIMASYTGPADWTLKINISWKHSGRTYYGYGETSYYR